MCVIPKNSLLATSHVHLPNLHTPRYRARHGTNTKSAANAQEKLRLAIMRCAAVPLCFLPALVVTCCELISRKCECQSAKI